MHWFSPSPNIFSHCHSGTWQKVPTSTFSEILIKQMIGNWKMKPLRFNTSKGNNWVTESHFMKAAGGFCRRHIASFFKKDNLKSYYCPYSFLHILVDVYVSRRLFFFLNWDSPSDCLCKKSYEFWPKFCYFKSGPTFPQQSMGVFKHSLERKSSFLRKEGRFYLVSSLSKHFIQVHFWGFPSLWFFFSPLHRILVRDSIISQIKKVLENYHICI